MAIDNYIEWLNSLEVPWLTGNEVGKAYNQLWGQLTDDQVALFKEAIKARMPNIAPADAVPVIAGERSIIDGYNETTQHLRWRAQSIWQMGEYFGTPTGLMMQLAYQGFDGYMISASGIIWYVQRPLLENDPGFPINQMHVSYAGANPLIYGSPPYFAMPVRSYSATPTAQDWDYNLPNQFGVQQNNRFILFCNTPPAAWAGGVPSQSQLAIIQSIVSSWAGARSIFEGVLVNNGASIQNWNAISGTSIAGIGSVDVYLSQTYV